MAVCKLRSHQCRSTPRQPKYITKDEFRRAAIDQLKISNSSFDFAWIDAIETSGRHDWYEPLRKRKSPIAQA